MTVSIDAGLRKVLNAHGYAFQHSVVRRAEELFLGNRSSWIFEATEFPVRVNEFDTKLDVLLRNRGRAQYLIGECKRANPGLSNWCFARAPYIKRGDQVGIVFETLRRYADSTVAARGKALAWEKEVYQIAVELRSGDKGDSVGSAGRGAVEEAAGQVSKGVNGFAEFLARKWPNLIDLIEGTDVPLIPVIFTTANLWVTAADLSSADLASGELPVEAVTAEKRKWLWFSYHVSPGLKHQLPVFEAPHDLSDIFEADFIRTIAVVGPEGIDEFLTRRW
jgi:hypothetical protein